MRLILLPIMAVVSAAPISNIPTAMPDDGRCALALTAVRDAAGQPRLDRSPATPGEGYLIAAVDKRIDGCAVMQMHRRIDDLRPVPAPSVQPARLLPAK